MTLLTEMMERPLDPGYAAAAERRQASGLPAATGLRSPLLIIVAILVGALLGASALALRAPTTAASRVKRDLISQIENRRAHSDAQTQQIASLRTQINAAQAAALSQTGENGLGAKLLKLELVAGAVPVTGPGLVLTVDDAPTKSEANAADANPRTSTEQDQGKVIDTDLQIIVNGLWDAKAEAISINGHRLTARVAIRSAGAAILVDYRPLTRPYVITAIGDPSSLGVEFADNSGGSYLQSLTNNFRVRGDIQSRQSVVVPGEPTLSLQKAKPVVSAVTKLPAAEAPTNTSAPTNTRAPTNTGGPTTTSRTTAPRTTETSP